MSTADAAAPAIPSGIHLASASATTLTVGLNRASGATSYRVYAARTRPELYVANITSKTKYGTASTPRVTVRGLTYTTATYWYRVETLNKTSHHWGTEIYGAGLKPATPTGLTTVTGTIGTYLKWTHQSTGNGFVIAQATNAAMTQNRVNRSLTGPNYQFSPYGISKGVRYYFQIYARNVSTGSNWSAQVSVVPQSSQSTLRVMTYNILEGSTAGTKESGTTLPSWSARRAGVAALINAGSPDVAGIQEAAAWTTKTQGYGGTRQIDDLMRLLPGYALASTEVPPSVHGYMRTGVYIIYKKSTYTTVGAGGHWAIGDGRWGVYQEMQSKASGARFLFVSAHLTTGTGAHWDTVRENETKTLYKDAAVIANRNHLRVVWTGDFNSDINAQHAFDGPGIEMRATLNTDASAAAMTRYNATLNSSNGYQRTAPAFSQCIDYVYVGAGVAVYSWGVIATLKSGKFVGTIPSDHNPVWATIRIAY